MDLSNALNRQQIAAKYHKEMGCENGVQAHQRLVSYAARRTGPPYQKVGGITAPIARFWAFSAGMVPLPSTYPSQPATCSKYPIP